MQRGSFNITARAITIATIRGIEQTAHTLSVGFNIEDFVRLVRKISVRMSEEKQDKESKKVAERVISIKRGDVFKNEVATDNIW